MTKKLMALVLILIIGTTSIYAKNNRSLVKYNKHLVNKYLNELNHFDINQIETLRFVFNASRAFDLSYTMTAICMEESMAGKYLFNLTGDYGIVGINVKSYLKNNKKSHDYYSTIALASKLMKNDAYDLRLGIEIFRYWLKYHHKDYIKAWASYNGGYRKNYYYANRIYNRIRALRIYNKRHPYALKDVINFE